MRQDLDILSVGAVTAAGLTAPQTAAAFRAGITGFYKDYPLPPPLEPLTVARIPVHASLRKAEGTWLINMASRALRECLHPRPQPMRFALILNVPESEREHIQPEELMAAVRKRLADRRIFAGYAFADGGAGIATGIELARNLLASREVDACLVGGVDSLVNHRDMSRLRSAGRVLESGNPKGLIPGEAAAVVLVAPARSYGRALAKLCGVYSTTEADPVKGNRLSQGRGFGLALGGALRDAGLAESDVSFRVSTVNGEHYSVWETVFSTARAYRTRRESLPVWYTASSFGDCGAASGALAVVLAALGIAGGYAPGGYAMCESASDSGLRGACIIGAAEGMPAPPFRAEEGASLLVRKLLLGVE